MIASGVNSHSFFNNSFQHQTSSYSTPVLPTELNSHQRGTRHHCFRPEQVIDGSSKSAVYLQSITAMNCYNTKSFEELRWEDYILGQKNSTVITNQSEPAAEIFSNPFSLNAGGFTNFHIPEIPFSTNATGFASFTSTSPMSKLGKEFPYNQFEQLRKSTYFPAANDHTSTKNQARTDFSATPIFPLSSTSESTKGPQLPSNQSELNFHFIPGRRKNQESIATSGEPLFPTSNTIQAPRGSSPDELQIDQMKISRDNNEKVSSSEISTGLDLAWAWECLQPRKSKDPAALKALLEEELGVFDARDFEGVERKYYESIASWLKPAPQQNFRKALQM